MTPKRNRSLHVSAGLMTALSLGVASLAGCASFDPVGPGQPTAVTQVPPTTGLPAAPGAGTTTPTTTPPTATTPVAALSRFTGKVEVGGKPVANATIQVFNALTNKPVSGLVAAGAGNLVAAGAGNLVAAGAGNYGLTQATTIKTDAEGNFDVELPELKKTDLVRVVATSADGVPLSTLTGELAGESQYSVQAGKKFNLKINISSTLATNMYNGVLSLLKAMPDGATLEDAIDSLVDNIASTQQKIETNYSAETQSIIYNTMEKYVDNLVGVDDINLSSELNSGVLVYNDLSDAFKDAGLDQAVSPDDYAAFISEALKEVIAAAAEGGGLNGALLVDISSEDFPEEININLDNITTGDLTFTDPITDELVVVDVIEEEPDTNIDDTFTDSAKLAPTVDIVYDKGDANSKLKMTVTQTSSEFDVKTITAKIPKSFVKTINLDDATTLNDAAETTVSGGWAGFATASNHTITAVSNSATTFDGDWEDGNSVKIADVTVKDDGGYVTITLTFDIAGNDAIHTQGGSAKLEALDSVITLDTDAIAALKSGSDNIVDISIETRNGDDLPTTTTDTGAAVIYGRPITVIDAL